jgi:hypothetical protein
MHVQRNTAQQDHFSATWPIPWRAPSCKPVSIYCKIKQSGYAMSTGSARKMLYVQHIYGDPELVNEVHSIRSALTRPNCKYACSKLDSVVKSYSR